MDNDKKKDGRNDIREYVLISETREANIEERERERERERNARARAGGGEIFFLSPLENLKNERRRPLSLPPLEGRKRKIARAVNYERSSQKR